MEATVVGQVTLSVSGETSEFDVELPGRGLSRPGCGSFRSYGHVVGSIVHGETRVWRCHRIQCPDCWDQPAGFVDRAADRILAGLARNMPDGILADEFLHELTIRQNSWKDKGTADLFDATYRREVVRRVVTSQKILGAFSSLLHVDAVGPECPVQVHLHVFYTDLPGPTRIGPVDRHTAGLTVRAVRKPGLLAALRGCRLIRRATGPGMGPTVRRRTVPAISWGGRRKPKKDFADQPELVPTRYCKHCRDEVPEKDWHRVEPTDWKPSKEGIWAADVDRVRVLDGRDLWGNR